ncbi:unnamed protein product [Brassicogethes aeneus]|uniref:Uncharacterized protein n=1 Tax=Brassicogethes aeneus TaxID=1431903 RepID=A0A9P0AXB6_BRAAE|nr:unnamed protein product [Brassicogethes aeneus]
MMPPILNLNTSLLWFSQGEAVATKLKYMANMATRVNMQTGNQADAAQDTGTTSSQKVPTADQLSVNKTNKESINLNNEWKEVKEKKKPKTPIIRGTADSVNSKFKAAEKLAWLYVGGCKWSTEPKDVKAYLEEKIPNEKFNVEELTKYAENLNTYGRVRGAVLICDERRSGAYYTPIVTGFCRTMVAA